MPQLGETVTEGTVTRWLKQVGDQVAPDELIFEVSTDKVDSEVPSPSGGYLLEILVPEGETVPVGTRLAVLGDAPPGQAPAGDGGGRGGGRPDGRASGGRPGGIRPGGPGAGSCAGSRQWLLRRHQWDAPLAGGAPPDRR